MTAHDTDELRTLDTGERDTVAGCSGTPTIVSLSDVHGHLDRARSALLAPTDHDAFDPIVETDADGRLHWAGNDYVLVFNGDLVDRGPDSPGCVALARRLRSEAPRGRVRYHLGNHESFLLFTPHPDRDRWYTDHASTAERKRWYEEILAGDVTLVYEGYEYTFVHAGAADGVDAAAANDDLRAAAAELSPVVGTAQDRDEHERVFREDADLLLFAEDDEYGSRGPTAGLLWLDFEYLPADAPRQVVGHTRHEDVTRKGNVVCGDTVLDNIDSPGGESLVVETPDTLRALVREPDGVSLVKSDPLSDHES